MSPEQGRGDANLDGRSDLYSLGVIVFEMLAGRVPYDASTPMGQVLKHMTEPIPNILEIDPNLPAGVQNVLSQALAKRPYVRYASAGEFAASLGAASRGESVIEKPGSSATMALSKDELHQRTGSNPRPGSPSTPGRKTNTPQKLRTTPTPQPRPKKRSRLPVFMIVFALLAALAGGAWYITGGELPAVISGLAPAVAAPAALNTLSTRAGTAHTHRRARNHAHAYPASHRRSCC